FMVFTVGEALIDPDTGAKLGADQKQTGDGAVVEVQSKYAVINFTGAAKPKDTIRKQYARSAALVGDESLQPLGNLGGDQARLLCDPLASEAGVVAERR